MLGKAQKTPEEVTYTVQCHASEFKKVFSTDPKSTSRSVSRWIPLTGDVLKVNIDGSYFPGRMISGWGFVTRNSAGEAVVAGVGNNSMINVTISLVVTHTYIDALIHLLSRMVRKYKYLRRKKMLSKMRCAAQQKCYMSVLSPLEILGRFIQRWTSRTGHGRCVPATTGGRHQA